MRFLRGFLMFMGALASLAIIALIIGYMLALLTPDIRANMRPVVLSSEAVDSLNQKISDLKTDAATAINNKSPKDINLVITEEEVNSKFVMMLAEGDLPAKEILINFNEGYLLSYTVWSIPGLPLKTGILGQIEISDGKPEFIVRHCYLGKLPLPGSTDRNIQNLLNIIIKLNVPIEELKLDIKDVTIGEGQIRISAIAGAINQ